VYPYAAHVAEQAIDLFVPGRGFPLEIVRTYKSDLTAITPLGLNWDINVNKYLSVPPDEKFIHYHNGYGRDDIFIKSGTDWITPAGLYARLTKEPDGTFTLRWRNGKNYHFGINLKIESISDRHGNTMYFEYDVGGRLETLKDTLWSAGQVTERKISFFYDSANRMTEVRDWAGRSVLYSYYSRGEIRSEVGALSHDRRISFRSHHVLSLSASRISPGNPPQPAIHHQSRGVRQQRSPLYDGQLRHKRSSDFPDGGRGNFGGNLRFFVPRSRPGGGNRPEGKSDPILF
jgi:hypothetical protein